MSSKRRVRIPAQSPAPARRLVRFRLLFWFTVVLSVLVRLILDTGAGYRGDVAIYLVLTWKTVHAGFTSAYQATAGIPPFDNPPVLIYPFWLIGWFYRLLFAPSFPPPWIKDPDLLRFLIRLPSLAAEILTATIIYKFLQKKCASRKLILTATLLYLVNPALIFDSAYWGQTAAIHTFFMLLAAMAANQRLHLFAGAALAAAILTKPQALALAPLLFVVASQDRQLVRFAAGGAIAAFLITLPFLVTGNIDGVINQYLSTAEFHPVVSANAHNWWWLVTGGHGWQPDTSNGQISFRVIGMALFLISTMLSTVLVWRNRNALFFAGAYQSLAFFMLNTQIHENHALPMLAFLVIASALSEPVGWLFYGALTLTSLANMVLHDPNLIQWLGYPPNEIFGGPALAVPRLLNAGAQAFLFAAYTYNIGKKIIGSLLAETSPMKGNAFVEKANSE